MVEDVPWSDDICSIFVDFKNGGKSSIRRTWSLFPRSNLFEDLPFCLHFRLSFIDLSVTLIKGLKLISSESQAELLDNYCVSVLLSSFVEITGQLDELSFRFHDVSLHFFINSSALFNLSLDRPIIIPQLISLIQQLISYNKLLRTLFILFRAYVLSD